MGRGARVLFATAILTASIGVARGQEAGWLIETRVDPMTDAKHYVLALRQSGSFLATMCAADRLTFTVRLVPATAMAAAQVSRVRFDSDAPLWVTWRPGQNGWAGVDGDAALPLIERFKTARRVVVELMGSPFVFNAPDGSTLIRQFDADCALLRAKN